MLSQRQMATHMSTKKHSESMLLTVWLALENITQFPEYPDQESEFSRASQVGVAATSRETTLQI